MNEVTNDQPTPENQNQESPKSKKSNKSTILVAILAVIIIVQAVKIYLDHQESVATEEELSSTEEELAITMQRLTDISEELEQKIREIDSLGGNIEELVQARDEIQRELTRSRKASRSTIAELKDKVDGYEVLLKAKDEEIEKLKEINTELLSENTNLKTDKNQLSDSIRQLSQTKEQLASKVAIASHLRAENIQVLALNRRGKEKESPFKSRQIEKLKVVFNIAENNVAPIEGKNILVRVVDGNGQVIFDVSRGSGTFMFNGKEEFYTANQEILFDNSRQQLTFEYEKGTDYEEGLYTLEVYTDDYKMGSVQFEVR